MNRIPVIKARKKCVATRIRKLYGADLLFTSRLVGCPVFAHAMLLFPSILFSAALSGLLSTVNAVPAAGTCTEMRLFKEW